VRSTVIFNDSIERACAKICSRCAAEGNSGLQLVQNGAKSRWLHFTSDNPYILSDTTFYCDAADIRDAALRGEFVMTE